MSACAAVPSCTSGRGDRLGGGCQCKGIVEAEMAAGAALCGPVSDCVGGPVVGSIEIPVGPQIEDVEIA